MERRDWTVLTVVGLVAIVSLAASASGAPASSTPTEPSTTAAFGRTTVGSMHDLAADQKRASRFSVTESSIVSEISAYLDGKGSKKGRSQAVRYLIYADSGGRPGSLLGATAPHTIVKGATGAWVTLALATPLSLAPGAYHLGVHGGTQNGAARYSAVRASGAMRHNKNLFAAGPSDPFGSTSSQDQSLSIFATRTTVPAATPSNTGVPEVSGTAQVGQTLAASPGTWNGAPTSFAYQWLRCDSGGGNCQKIAGATATSHRLDSADQGSTVRVVVTATNAAGSTSATSAPTALVLDSAPANAALPMISGTPQVGQTLTVSQGSWTGSPSSYTYQWRRCDVAGASCQDVTGATAATHVAGSMDKDATLRAVVTATNSGGSTSATTSQTSVVQAPPAPAPGEPSVSRRQFVLADGDPARVTLAQTPAQGNLLIAAGFARSGSIPHSIGTGPADQQNVSVGQTTSTGWTKRLEANHFPGEVVGRRALVVWTKVAGPNEPLSVQVSGTTQMLLVQELTGGAAWQFLAAASHDGGAPNGAFTATGSGQTASVAAGDLLLVGLVGVRRATDWGNGQPPSNLTFSGLTSPVSGLLGGDQGRYVATGFGLETSGGAKQTTAVWSGSGNSGASGAILVFSLAAPEPAPPVNTSQPTISGSTIVGRTLTASPGSWSGHPAPEHAYQWGRCDAAGTNCAAISGATSSTYALVAADEGRTARVVVTASNPSGAGSSMSAQTATVTVAADAADSCPVGQFRSEFFNNRTATGSPVLSRCDDAVNWDWGSGSPGAGVNVDNFSARLVGQFNATRGGVHTFRTIADDGVRVFVNGVGIIDGWVDQPPTTYIREVELPVGTHEVRIEYYESAGGAVLRYSVVPPAPTTPPDTPIHELPRIPWEGGAAFYEQFPKAHAEGWSSPGFFPLAVFYGKPAHTSSLRSVGINTLMGAEHDGSSMASITNTGMFVLAQQEWRDRTPAEIGNNPRVVGWHVHDECEMGYSGCSGNEHQALAQQQAWVNELRALDDGRFMQANFGNGVLGSFWAPSTFHQFVQGVDASSVDKYAYTSPHLWWAMASPIHSPHWPRKADGTAAPVARSAAYGWLADRLRAYQDPSQRRPVWVFVETAMPFLTEQGAQTITADQIEGAVWSAIIHEARGIAYFQHNNNGLCGVYSIVECGPTLRNKLTAVHEKIRLLAPVINSQSYEYNFYNGTDTMLKVHGGSAYVFAGIGLFDDPGSKTFRLPTGVNGTMVTVVGENRTIPVVDGTFTDTFAHEFTHHVYRISLSAP
jgi:hypothetical protein